MKIYSLREIKMVYFLLMIILCLPHIFIYFIIDRKKKLVINHDIRRWIDCTVREHHTISMDLIYLLAFYNEFRNIYYLRLGKLSYFLRYLRPLSSLYISTRNEDFGAGTFIQHGFSTIITADKIGEDCWINQQVTIGYNDSKKYGYGKPIIGDNVRISAGAKVCGKVTVGNGSTIGVNAVVIKDVPPHSTIVPSPMILIQENGEKTYRKL